ncbi:MAG TPA: hypothetical protein VFB00_06850 [Terriglobales bacterium]|nr:hypothetical protein [Terriglobales bacterium]
MSDMERDLREALRRVEPPEGFAGRVLARTAQQARPRPWYATYGAIAAAIVLVCSLFIGQYVRHERQKQEAAQAQRQLTFALRLTAEKLAVIHQRLKVSAPVVRVEREQRREL